MAFALDPRLEAASGGLVNLPLCGARLQNDSRFPWIVLVPARVGVHDLDDLSEADMRQVIIEIAAASAAVRSLAASLGRPADKLNVAAIGNIVPQLHIHVVARRRDDPAWPAPVWGFGAPIPYASDIYAAAALTARQALVKAFELE